MKEVCARITWAVIDDGRSFFGWNPVSLDFAPGAQFYFLTSFLKGITDAVRNTLIIQWARFPCEWLSPVAPEDVWCATHTCPPRPATPRHQAPLPRNRPKRRTHPIPNYVRSWIHTYNGKTMSSTCQRYSHCPESG
jgi:hypothetical protein